MPTVPIESVVPDPNQPRKTFNEKLLKELRASIKTHGLLQPVVVTPGSNGKFIIVAGERRYRACVALGWTSIPVVILDAPKHPGVLQLVENLHREDLISIEEAKAFKALIDKYNYTQTQAAKLVNKSKAYVSERLALLNLQPNVQQLVLDGQLAFSHARLLAQAPEGEREQLATDAAKAGTSARELKKKVKPKKEPTPDEIVVKAQKDLSRARTLVDKALQKFAIVADAFEEHDQHRLADVVEHMEQADGILEGFTN